MASLRSSMSLCSSLSRLSLSARVVTPIASSSRLAPVRAFSSTFPPNATINQVMRGCRTIKTREPRSPALEGNYQKKGVCARVMTKKPKKPNSANRKICRVKLSTGNLITAHIPGEGHNVQEHSVVLIRGGRAKDLPGVRYKVVRGAMDVSGVAGRVSARSKFGAKKPKKGP